MFFRVLSWLIFFKKEVYIVVVSRKERRERSEVALRIERRYEMHRRRNLAQARAGKLKFIIVLDNLKISFNMGKIFRSADAFGAREVHLVGNHFFDPGPSRGSFKKVPVKYFADFQQSYDYLQERDYTMFTMEPEGSTFLHHAILPEKSAFIMGNEEFGISFTRDDFPGVDSLAIAQHGMVESLNVSVAASVVMYEYFRQHELPEFRL